jgi:hypothetical protein
VISYRLLAGSLLILNWLLVLPQNGHVATSRSDLPSSGRIPANRAYTNEAIGFTYPLPDGFQFNEDAAKQFQLRPGTGTLFVADQVVTDRACVNRVMVMADDTRRYHPPMSTFDSAVKLTAGLIKNPDVTLIRGVHLSTVGGRRAYRADLMKKLACGFLYQSLFVIKVRSFEVYWMLGGFSQQERDELLGSLQAISFQK